MTGAPIPPGSDAVVRLEDTRPGQDGAAIEILHEPAVGEFIRPAGEDLKRGERVLEQGRVLRPADLGLLASMGRPSVEVRVAPRVAIVSTGDELCPLGTPLGPGQIYNSNAYALAAAVRAAGGIPIVAPIVPDRPSRIREAFLEAGESDIVLSTGGVSVGDHDHVRPIMAELGLEQRFWRVAQKPGKPIAFAQGDARLYFGLPGNPVSSLVCFFLYVAPALRRSLGRRDVFPARMDVTMASTVATARDLTELVRCRIRREGAIFLAEPTGTQSSGALRSLALADALVLSLPGIDRLIEGERYPGLLLDATAERDPFR
jgi:molybdopterin molybdotransferase